MGGTSSSHGTEQRLSTQQTCAVSLMHTVGSMQSGTLLYSEQMQQPSAQHAVRSSILTPPSVVVPFERRVGSGSSTGSGGAPGLEAGFGSGIVTMRVMPGFAFSGTRTEKKRPSSVDAFSLSPGRAPHGTVIPTVCGMVGLCGCCWS